MLDWDWQIFWNDFARISVAAVMGGAIGLEREWHGHWAGLRTHMMVAIGCAIFVITGLALSGPNSNDAATRAVQGVAAGVGFLGAGTILKLDRKREIKGLTTASSIWLAAALGTAAGIGEYALAVAAALISLFVLGVLRPIEKFLERHNILNPNHSDDDM